MNNPTTRLLKVERKTLTLPSQLRLKGKWLERAGFPPGSRVKVIITNGTLTIQPV